MKIILLMDVKNLGKKDELVEASAGYATNYLIPHKLAVLYTPKSQEILLAQQKEHADQLEAKKLEAMKVQDALTKVILEFKAKVAPDGRMVGSISYKEVEDELKNKHQLTIDKRKFIDKYQINAFGTTKLKIELFKGIIGTINVHVSEEK